MTVRVSRLVHPYFNEISFDSEEVERFPFLSYCPACGSSTAPEILSYIGAKADQTSVQFAQCYECDHLFYRNPPPAGFFADFYRDVWNAKRGEAVDDKLITVQKSRRTAARLARDIGLGGEDKRVLEIGCGLGAMLAGLRDAGFTNLHGTEASSFRAASARTLFPDTIYSGGYEAVPDDLKFDFIFSHHVVEHIFDPFAAFGWMASRLRAGGTIAITVPDAWHEPVLNQLLFLPHLHSFCHRALMSMGRSHGFSCYFWKSANIPHEICAVYSRQHDPQSLKVDKFIKASQAMPSQPKRQRERVSRFFHLADSHRHFALHTGETDTVKMAQTGGIRLIGPSQAAFARARVTLGRHVAAWGLRRFGNKRLGRTRYIECQSVSDECPSCISDELGNAGFHIK